SKKGRRMAGPFVLYAYATLLNSNHSNSLRCATHVLVGGRSIAGEGVNLRHDAHDALTHRERNVGAAQAEVRQLAIGHAMELVFGRAPLEVGPDGGDGTLDQTGDPQAGVDQEHGAREASFPLETALVGVGKTLRVGGLCVSARRFTGQLLKSLDRLGHHGWSPCTCAAAFKCCAAHTQYRSL